MLNRDGYEVIVRDILSSPVRSTNSKYTISYKTIDTFLKNKNLKKIKLKQKL